MMQLDEIKVLIQKSLPDAHVQVEDMTGGNDHFQIYVVSSAFKGKTLVDQHRLVQQALRPAFDDERIHAVQIKTETPEGWAKSRSSGDDLKIIG